MAALAIALLIFSVAVSIYSASTAYQQMRYNQAREVVQNFREDFGRALIGVLAKFTQGYNATAEMETPRMLAYYLFSYWTRAAATSFASQGIQLDFSLDNVTLQDPGVFYGFNLTEPRNVYSLTKLYWYTPQSMSAVSASFDANLTALGLYNWHEQSMYLLNLTLNSQNITQVNVGGDTYALLNLTVNKEFGSPVEDLSPGNFKVAYFDSGLNSWLNANITKLFNLGGGQYTMLLSNATGRGPIQDPYYKYLLVFLQDTRGVVVEAYSYTYIDYSIQERAIGPIYKPYETYTFEMLNNGSMMWFNRILPTNSSYVPIPLPPVKQFRVYATVNGYNDTNMVEVPSQVEVWTPDYSTPTLQFADWRRRFEVGDKLVFTLNYAPAGVTVQRARITWLFDADALPPAYGMNFTSNGNLMIINNKIYSLGLVANQSLSNWIDYNMQVNSTNQPSGYHVEYTLFGYDVYPMSGGYWFPAKLPWGPGTNQGWNYINGSVRSVAYRTSNWTYSPPTNTYYNGANAEINHTEIILIPLNVSYFESYFYGLALKDISFYNQYVTYVGMISGTTSDTGSPYRLQYGSVQLVDSNYNILRVQNGTYSNSGSVMHILNPTRAPNSYLNLGWWMSEYGQYRGQAIFLDNSTLASLKGSPVRTIWTWTSADGYRRVNEYDYAYWRQAAYTLPKGTVLNFNFAGWMYGGGSLGSLFSDTNYWANGSSSATSSGVADPNTYYRMFVGGSFDPMIISMSGGV